MIYIVEEDICLWARHREERILEHATFAINRLRAINPKKRTGHVRNGLAQNWTNIHQSFSATYIDLALTVVNSELHFATKW